MPTWTFVVEFDGGTFVSQFEAESLDEAISDYNESDLSDRGAVQIGLDAVELDGLRNAFCSTCLAGDSERLVLAQIIKTDVSA